MVPAHLSPGIRALTEYVRIERPRQKRFTGMFRKQGINAMVASYRQKDPHYKMGAFSPLGMPATRTGGQGWTEKHVALARFRRSALVSGVTMKLMESFGQPNVPVGMQAVAEELEGIVAERDELLEWLCCQIVTNPGTISVPLEGGSTYTIDSGVPSALKAAYVPASWATAGTDIFAQIRAAQTAIADAYGVTARTVLMNDATFRSTVLKNTEWKAWAVANPEISRQMAETGTVSNCMGFRFETYDAKYNTAERDDALALSLYIPNNQVTLIPDNFTDACRAILFEGPNEDVECPVGFTGPFVKSKEKWDPSGVEVLMNHVFGPVMKVPAVFQWADVTDTTP